MKEALARITGQPIERTLFSYVGVALPMKRRPIAASNSVVSYGHLALVVSNGDVEINVHAFDLQLCLPIAFLDNPTNITRFFPRTRYVFLDYGVFDSFRHNPLLAKPATKLEERGYHLIGQLVQLSELELRALPFITDTHVEAMQKQLAQVGLSFGMTLPGWKAPADIQR